LITQRPKTYLLFALLLGLVAIIATGCASGSASLVAGSSWPGIATSSDTAYIAYASKIYAVDITTADARWSFPTKAVNGQSFYAPPAIADNLVVVTDYRDSATALSASDGTQLWTYKSKNSRFIGGAVIGEQYVYAATVDGVVHALDRETGEEAWSYTARGSIWSTPLLSDGVLYITALDHHLYALDATSGELAWEFSRTEGAPVDSPPVGAMVGTPTLYEGVLYFGSFGNHLYALNIDTHDVVWSYDTTNWVWSGPAIDEQDNLLVGADLDGNIFALKLEDGSPIWTYTATGPIVGAPLIGEIDGKAVVYLTCGGDPNLIVLNAGDGTEAVKSASLKADFSTSFLFIPTGTNTRSIPIYASPVKADKLVLIGAHEGNDILYALDSQTMQEKWRFNPTDYEKKLQETQGEAPQSFLSNPMNIILLMAITFLMATMLGRGRQQQK
jgi:outer membrane protein assembly factor BamB